MNGRSHCMSCDWGMWSREKKSRLAFPSEFRSTRHMPYFTEDPEELVKREPFGFAVDLHWYGLRLPETFAEAVKPYEKPCRHGDENAFTLHFLSESPAPVGMWCTVHGHIKDGGLTLLHMALRRKPTADPPLSIVEISAKFGGYPNGFRDFIAPLVGHTGEAEAEIRFVFQTTPLKIGPREIASELAPLKWKSEVLTLVAEDGAEIEMAFLEKDGVMVKMECKFPLVLEDQCFESAAAIVREKLTPLITKG